METLEEYQSQLPQSQLKNRVAKKIVTASLASLAVTPSENLDMVAYERNNKKLIRLISIKPSLLTIVTLVNYLN